MNKKKQQILDELQLKYGRKDLSFGCEVETNEYTGWETGRFYFVKPNTRFKGIFIGVNKKNRLHQRLIDQKVKIIGHPLTLSDVLFNSPKGLLVDRNGIFYEPETLKPLNLGAAWAMKFNLVRDQGERCIRFISKFLNLKNDD